MSELVQAAKDVFMAIGVAWVVWRIVLVIFGGKAEMMTKEGLAAYRGSSEVSATPRSDAVRWEHASELYKLCCQLERELAQKSDRVKELGMLATSRREGAIRMARAFVHACDYENTFFDREEDYHAAKRFLDPNG